MKVEYDPIRDVLYLWLAAPGTTAASTTVVSPGVHADVDQEGTMIGLEVLDASRQPSDTCLATLGQFEDFRTSLIL